MSDISIEMHPKAQKECYCDVCGKPIRKNERYWQQIYNIGDRQHTSKICRVCENIVDEYALESGEDTFTLCDLELYLRDTFCDDCENEGSCGLRVLDCPNIREAFGRDAEV